MSENGKIRKKAVESGKDTQTSVLIRQSRSSELSIRWKIRNGTKTLHTAVTDDRGAPKENLSVHFMS